jgi:2-hydroxy fatty acid dioxygenase
MEPVAGTMVTPLILGGTAFGKYLTENHNPAATYAAAGLFVASWLAQFVGHGKFEGRAPALLDNLIQALFLAPFFVWMEILFKFGYRPDLKGRLDKAVEKEILKYRNSKGKTNGSINGKTE